MYNFLQKIKNFSLFELRPEPISVSFNDSSLRFLELQKKTSVILPRTYWREILQKDTVVGGEIKDQKRFVESLKNGLQKIGVANKKNIYAVVVLPENSTFLKSLSLQKMSAEEINALLGTLIEQNMPLPKEEAEADWQFARPEENSEQSNILIAAAPKLNIQKILESMQLANITPVALDAAPLSIVRALINLKEPAIARLLIHFNHDKTIFVLHDGRSIILSISDPNGIDAMQKKIAAELNTEIVKIPELAYVKGFSTEDAEIKKALENSLSEIIEQINKFKSFEHAPTNTDGSSLKNKYACQEVILSGYLSAIPGMADFISSRTDLPTYTGNPWQQNSQMNIVPQMSLDESLQFCATIGGALYARSWFSKPILK